MHRFLKVAAACAAAVLSGGVPRIAGERPPAIGPSILETYGRLPLTFEKNEGQLDETVKFVGRGRGATLFVTPVEAVLNLRGQSGKTAVVRMRLTGANRDPHLVGLEPQQTRSNYFLGGDPRRWHTGLVHYARVQAERVYPGVDLIYRGDRRQLEYDLVVDPGADPGRIRLAFSGAESIALGSHGELILRTAAGDLVQPRPAVYQDVGQQRPQVEGRYVLFEPATAVTGEAHTEVGFAVGAYDRSRPLIIDPVLVYSTFLGGSGLDGGAGIAVDGAGNAYVTGSTGSMTFPGVAASSIQSTESGVEDAFVTKINASGTAIVYSTFLGGDRAQIGAGIAVDGAGNAYVTGVTTSTTLPGVGPGSIQPVNHGGGDAFVTKINAGGTAIVYSTFLGGSGNDGGSGIAVDSAGNAYVTGFTASATFPGVVGTSIQPANAGADDAFVTEINATGTAIVYSTFLGGGRSDMGLGIAVDRMGNAYVTGETGSPTFPGVSASSIQSANAGGLTDAFVTKINAAGTAILYSTYLGGTGEDSGVGIAVDGIGNAYVTGFTDSTSFSGVGATSLQPASGGGQDAFVTKIDASGAAIVYSSFLGGAGSDTGIGIAVDGAGNAYVTGDTDSMTFPGVTAGSVQPANGGGLDAFVTEIDAAGSGIVYSTFLGGGSDELSHGIAVDGEGNAYVTGETLSPTFPGIGGNSIQPVNGGGNGDALVVKIGSPAEIPAVSRWGLVAMAVLVGGTMLLQLRRRWR